MYLKGLYVAGLMLAVPYTIDAMREHAIDMPSEEHRIDILPEAQEEHRIDIHDAALSEASEEKIPLITPRVEAGPTHKYGSLEGEAEPLSHESESESKRCPFGACFSKEGIISTVPGALSLTLNTVLPNSPITNYAFKTYGQSLKPYLEGLSNKQKTLLIAGLCATTYGLDFLCLHYTGFNPNSFTFGAVSSMAIAEHSPKAYFKEIKKRKKEEKAKKKAEQTSSGERSPLSQEEKKELPA